MPWWFADCPGWCKSISSGRFSLNMSSSPDSIFTSSKYNHTKAWSRGKWLILFTYCTLHDFALLKKIGRLPKAVWASADCLGFKIACNTYTDTKAGMRYECWWQRSSNIDKPVLGEAEKSQNSAHLSPVGRMTLSHHSTSGICSMVCQKGNKQGWRRTGDRWCKNASTWLCSTAIHQQGKQKWSSWRIFCTSH